MNIFYLYFNVNIPHLQYSSPPLLYATSDQHRFLSFIQNKLFSLIPKMRNQIFLFIHGGNHFALVFFALLSLFLAIVTAQPDLQTDRNQFPKFSPSMAVIVVVLVSALFFMGFFSIYIRHCSDSGASGTIARALSLRARRAAASRGLDHAVLETFPTFSYAEVKDHKIGKGGGECAVCLNEFDGAETLRLLPKCDHVFHAECIDAWLESHVTCPVCRANLVPGDTSAEGGESVQPPHETATVTDSTTNDNIQRTNSNNNEEIVVQVLDESQQPTVAPAPPRSWSVRRPYKLFSFGKFRSHSTGHSMVQPAENLERFTLKLPEQVRKEVIDRAMLNRTRSLAVTLPGEGSSRTGYRSGQADEGSSRGGRPYRRLEVPEQGGRSDRWDFFTRMLSMKSPKVGTEIGEGSNSRRSGGRTPVKMPSIKCLEPKADSGDEVHLFSGESGRPPV